MKTLLMGFILLVLCIPTVYIITRLFGTKKEDKDGEV
jgi:hypothetical protein